MYGSFRKPSGTGGGTTRIKAAQDRMQGNGLYRSSISENALALGWLQGWKSVGWTRKDGKEVKNRDLWEEIERQTVRLGLQVEYICKSPYTAWMQCEMKKQI